MQQVARRTTTMCQALAGLLLLPLLLLAPAFTSRAAEPGVTDDAKFFSSDAVEKANAEIKRIKADTGKDLVIETFPTIPDDRKAAWEAAKDDAAKKREFFAQWITDRGRALKIAGVYVLICREPAHLEVKAGKQTLEKAFTKENQDRLSKILLDAFKAKDYDAGLTKGVDYVRDTLKQNLGGARDQTSAAGDPFPGGASSGSGGSHAPAAGSSTPTPYPTGQAPRTNTGPQSQGFHFSCMWIVLIIIGVFVLFRLLRGMGGSRNVGGPGYGQGPGPGYGGGSNYGPGYGPNYGGGGAGGGGGGFMRGLFGGLLGGAAGSYMYDKMSHQNQSQAGPVYPPQGGNVGGGQQDNSSSGGDFGSSSSGEDFSGGGSSGGDFGSSDSGGGGGDMGGGGDSGGSSGGDF